jgi:hypothetical protein
MAQSLGDPKGIKVHLDDQDRDFIAQAVAQGVTPATALRTRYTLLLRDRPGEGGPVRFLGRGRTPFITVNIARTHLRHLQDKLRRLGAVHVAEHGLTPLAAIDPADTAAYHNAAFSRDNAADILRTGKPIEINYGRGGVATAVTLKAAAASPAEVTGRKRTGPARPAVVKPVPNDWSTSYLRTLFSDPGRGDEVARFLTLGRLPRATGTHDLTHLWQAVGTLVGDTREPGKYVLPEVWDLFQHALPGVGEAILAGVSGRLRQFDPSAAEDVPELKQAVMQAAAMILSNPLRGARAAKASDFLRDVADLFSRPDEVAKMAMSYTTQGHLRKVAGINTANTRRREIGGERNDRPYDLQDMGREDPEHLGDDEIEVELRALEPAAERVRGKLQRSRWDAGRLTGQEFDLFTRYEQLAKELQRFRQASHDNGRRAAAAQARGPVVHPEQARVARVEAELERLGPRVRPVIGKLDAAGWDLSRVSDAEWELYRSYLRLEKELRRLKGVPLAGVDDRGVAAGAGQHFQRQSPGVKGEAAGGDGTPLLCFRAWCEATTLPLDIRSGRAAC